MLYLLSSSAKTTTSKTTSDAGVRTLQGILLAAAVRHEARATTLRHSARLERALFHELTALVLRAYAQPHLTASLPLVRPPRNASAARRDSVDPAMLQFLEGCIESFAALRRRHFAEHDLVHDETPRRLFEEFFRVEEHQLYVARLIELDTLLQRRHTAAEEYTLRRRYNPSQG